MTNNVLHRCAVSSLRNLGFKIPLLNENRGRSLRARQSVVDHVRYNVHEGRWYNLLGQGLVDVNQELHHYVVLVRVPTVKDKYQVL